MAQVPERLGKYQLLEVIGRGGVGEVFKAFQPDLNRTVAIKTLLAGEQASEDFIRRFQREASVAANLVHPNIVQVHDLGTEGRLHYIVMEYVEGKSLKEVAAERRLDVREALEIARSVARTLQFAHEKRIIHRDIKPANLVRDAQGRVRILDFGLAKSLADGKGLTVSNVMMGTPCYMSPEQAFGAPEEVDARTDVYSLGAVLYELVTGRLLFDGGTVLAILRKIEDEEPKAPGVSPAVDALVLRALAKDRDRRFASAAEMADAIDSILSGAETLPAAPRKPAPAPPRPRARWPFAAAAAILLLTILWAAWPGDSEETSAPEDRLEEILSAGGIIPDTDLDPFRDDPDYRRRIADHFLVRGQYGRAFEYLDDYERSIFELASAGALQRFVSPGLFPLWMEVPEDLDGANGFLLAAIRRHLDGNVEAAREKLGSAEAGGADPAHVLLVRAHLHLVEALSVPEEEERLEVLRMLEGAMDRADSDDPMTFPVRAIAAHLTGDPGEAWRLADHLRSLAPAAAETFLLRSILFQYEGRFGLALEALMDAERQHPGNLDPHLQVHLLRLLQILEEEGPPDPDDLEELRRAAEERLGNEPFPAALFLRAAVDALQSRFDEAQEALGELERQVPPERVRMPPGFLDSLMIGIESRALLLLAASELQEAAGLNDAARVTSEWLLRTELPEGERREIEREIHYRLAYLSPEPESALRHLEEALKRGLPVEELDNDELERLKGRREFRELREKYDR